MSSGLRIEAAFALRTLTNLVLLLSWGEPVRVDWADFSDRSPIRELPKVLAYAAAQPVVVDPSRDAHLVVQFREAALVHIAAIDVQLLARGLAHVGRRPVEVPEQKVIVRKVFTVASRTRKWLGISVELAQERVVHKS